MNTNSTGKPVSTATTRKRNLRPRRREEVLLRGTARKSSAGSSLPTLQQSKSELEAYLMTVLPFGAKHADAAETLAKLVPPRLEKNAKLRRKLRAWIRQRSGGTAIPFEHKPLEELFAMIAKALAWQYWGGASGKYRAIPPLHRVHQRGRSGFSHRCSPWKDARLGRFGRGHFQIRRRTE